MSFASAVDHLHALAQELSPSAPRRKFELEHMRVLACALGDPQQRFPSVLIAGTNGKGSTAATLASILTAAGLRTGLYTSPHLTRVTERIRTSDPALCADTLAEIGEEEFARIYFRVDETARILVADGRLPHHPSFFEVVTALAFVYFAERQVEVAVLEVGLGGRLDATNIVDPVLSVITDIALDHQDYLGNTITEITREKAGILRPNGTLVTLPQHPEANQAIGETATALNVRGISAADYLPGRELDIASAQSSVILSEARSAQSKDPERSHPASPAPPFSAPNSSSLSPVLTPNHYDLNLSGEILHVRSQLPGEHQRRNIALAIAAAIELRSALHADIPTRAIETGIAHTSWPGRLELLPPNLLLDVAHNPAGAWTLRAAIASLPESRPRTLLFSCLRDKDLTEMARILLPLFDSTGDRPHDHIVFAPIPNPRAASLDDLLAAAHALDIPAQSAPTAAEALTLARTLTPADGLIIATGSIFLIGALRDLALRQ
jgi:dihydrofolate synthase/folylpolyglutamate synthase